MKIDAEELLSLLNSVGGIFWEASPDMRRFYLVSDQLNDILGENPEDWNSLDGCWSAKIHPDDAHVVIGYRDLAIAVGTHRVFTYRFVRNDGCVVWINDTVTVIDRTDGSKALRGFMQDVSLTGRLQALEELERTVLRLNSDLLHTLPEVLNEYLQGLEHLFPQMHCSIHRVDNGRLASVVAPSLPAVYVAAVTGLAIGPDEGSCGAAAASGVQVVVSDIATDPRWDKYRDLAMSHGLRACWSNPVFDQEGHVIATLAMYYQEPRSPDEEENKVMEKATALLQVILENRRKTDQVQDANQLMQQSQGLAHFGNWRWQIQPDIVSWSPVLYQIYGLDTVTFKATFGAYLELLHPDDRELAYNSIQAVLQTGKEGSFEERIIRPDGETRYLRSWAMLKKDALGRPLEMIGACLDITEGVLQRQAIEQQNTQLVDIAWAQSHKIRSPLARIMSLVELLEDECTDQALHRQLLNYLRQSATELDAEVQEISRKTSTFDPNKGSEI